MLSTVGIYSSVLFITDLISIRGIRYQTMIMIDDAPCTFCDKDV